MAATSLGVFTMYAAWRWFRQPTWLRAVTFGVLLGLAEISKFVWLLLFPLCPLLWLYWQWSHRRERPWRQAILRDAPQFLMAILISLDVINLAYLAVGFGQPLKNYTVGTHILAMSQRMPGVISEVLRQLAECPAPLPADYLGGLGEIVSFVESQPSSYLRGESRRGGWWYYYLYAWGVKFPAGSWLIVFLAFFSNAVDLDTNSRKAARRSFSFLWIIICAVFLFVSAKSGSQYFRYSLPILPFVLIWASCSVVVAAPRPAWFRPALIFGVLWSISSSLLCFPHSISYFNEFSRGPRDGYKHLLHDSCDWGQDLLILHHWLETHTDGAPVSVAYWGWVDPTAAGINFKLPPTRSQLFASMYRKQAGRGNEVSTDDPGGLVPGWYAISVELIYSDSWIQIHNGMGGKSNVALEDFTYFREVNPTAMAGHSIRIFYLDDAAITRIMQTIENHGLLPSTIDANYDG